MKKIIRTMIILLLGCAQVAFAQDVMDTIFIKDASFEQQSSDWKECSSSRPVVGLTMHSGRTYKMLRQKLSKPLLKDKCYTLVLKVKQSKMGQAGAIFPNIRIWGGHNLCQRSELLGKTGPIAYMDWRTYKYKLNPKQDYQYIVLEAYARPQIKPGQGYFSKVGNKPYGGHVILGHISDILEMVCDEDAPKGLSVTHPEKAASKSKKIIMPELNKKISEGQVMRIKNLNFDANSALILQSGLDVLDELFHFLSENPSIRIEIGGHTNNRCDAPYCNSLSEKRAKAVADYLIDKGIASNRIQYKGYGKTIPVATNSTPKGRKSNQRVEVKILSQ